MSKAKHRVILTLPLDTLTDLLAGADGKTAFHYHPDGGKLTHDLLRLCKVTYVSVDHKRDCLDILLDCEGVLSDRETRPGSWPHFYHGHVSSEPIAHTEGGEPRD